MYRTKVLDAYTPEDRKAMNAFAQDYIHFISEGKTEREVADLAEALALRAGFRKLEDAVRSGEALKPGDRLYSKWMNKTFTAFVIGEDGLERGMNILGAHIDSPRLDIKQNPLFEEDGLAYLDTHYYGGIKKYQWLAMPLALHGVIALEDGRVIRVSIGEKENEPVFFISDLLPHLAQEQMGKTASTFVDGESGLNLLIGSEAKPGEEKDAVKAALLDLLQQQYGMTEEDFVSAELEIVPAGSAREAGLDRSMILGYGHDDRVCAFPSLMAVLNTVGTPKATLCAALTDKEEIGSVGATGMASHYFENLVTELVSLTEGGNEFTAKRCLANSRMLSSDVSAAYDPAYPSVFEKKNTAFLGMGVCFNKYTGSRGKGGSNDANAEFMAAIRGMMNRGGVCYQTSEIGKVDAGGGGTIAYLCAKYGMNVIDCGIAVLSMHAPWETISKADLYEAYRAYTVFLKEAHTL